MHLLQVKALSPNAARLGGYLLRWGSPAERDLHGDYFSPQTELGLDWYERRPMLYQHGLDTSLKASLIGQIDHLHADELGLWAEAQLDLRHRYADHIRRLIDQGALFWSSGSLPHLVQREADGHLRRWIIVEGSLTPTPAEPRLAQAQVLRQAYAQLGLDATKIAPPALVQSPILGEESLMTNLSTTASKRLPMAEAPSLYVASEFDRLSADDLLYGYLLLRAAKSFHGVSERYANALAYKVRQANLSSAIKADELAHSTQSGYGDEWVAELWSAQLWQRARLENAILPLFPSIDMPSNPFDLPLEGTDPQVYYVGETKDEAQLNLGAGNPIADSKIGSSQLTLTARKLALRVGFSSELVEDAIVPLLAVYRTQAMQALSSAIDDALLNGDTTTAATGNINSDAAAPPSGAPYLAFDGLRKLPLVTTTAQKVDMGGAAPTLAKLREARFAMPYRYSARPQHLAWIVDGGTYARLLSLSEFVTMDKAGPLATAQTGQIGFMDGAPVLVSSEFPLTSASGKVAASGNTRGTALCVYRPGWFVGYRRRVAVSVDYLPYLDSYQLTATVRLGFGRFDGQVASALVNIAV
ncbi:MAG: phage major capsid protein [Anaerolineae bacterium]|nr:phage major capsid protein [Anaerolineae bacterium]MDW8171729.1 phage major capsid protein [Anaerolineae bacterium]